MAFRWVSRPFLMNRLRGMTINNIFSSHFSVSQRHKGMGYSSPMSTLNMDKMILVQWKYGAFWSKRDLGYIRHVFCVSGRIYDTYHKSVGCHVGTLGEFFLFTKIQDGRQPLYSKKLTIHF